MTDGRDRELPLVSTVRRRLPEGEPVDITAALHQAWLHQRLGAQVAGKRIAIGVGSRGVAGIAEITRKVVALVRESGGDPFIVPAMGSHGGATTAGQVEVLAGLGVDAERMGCPVKATMETVLLGALHDGHPLYFDRYAAEADGLIIINRIKIHTDFHGPHESGLIKMLAIGLGKENGAAGLHQYGTYGLREIMPQVGMALLAHVNLIAAIATVEDGYHRPVRLEVLPPDHLIEGEKRLLDVARELFPGLPLDEIDVLIVDRIGKDISGCGMDTNVIGRMRIPGEHEPERPNIKALVTLDLTDASHGNGLGVGLSDFTTKRLVDKIDFPVMTKNVYTSGFLERGYIPLVYENDEMAIRAAIAHVYRSNPQRQQDVRLMRISSTMDLEELQVSVNLLPEIQQSVGFVSATEPQPLAFKDGALLF